VYCAASSEPFSHLNFFLDFNRSFLYSTDFTTRLPYGVINHRRKELVLKQSGVSTQSKHQQAESKAHQVSHSQNGNAEATGTSSNGTSHLVTKRDWILAGKIKASFCDICNEYVPKLMVGEWKPSDKTKVGEEKPSGNPAKSNNAADPSSKAQENQYWLKCPNCMQVQLVKEWQIQIDREPKLEDLKPEDCAKYFPQGLYTVGDAVFHPALKDVGIVRSKQTTASGANVIIVEFKQNGNKQLLENIPINADGSARTVTKKGKMKLKIKKS